MDVDEIRRRAAAAMPGLIEDLGRLVAHGSVAFPGFSEAPVRAAAAATVEVLTAAGFRDARILSQAEGYGPVLAEMPGPPGAPTVLLYAHYDVQPAPIEAGWHSDPYTLTERDGRLYGRGAADDKAGIVIHAGALRVLEGRPPVTLKVVIEGEEETESHLEALVAAEPERFRADVMVIADMGNLVVGEPVLTTTLRGDVMCLVEATTLAHPVHSGVFGGAAPDALVALLHVLGAMWDETGRTVIPGLHRYDWPGAAFPEDRFLASAGVVPGVDLPGVGSIATRLWSQPSATVLGLDMTPVAGASNVLIPTARAKVGMRIAPGADADRELELLTAFLRAQAPAWASITVTPVRAADAFEVPPGGPAVEAARDALRAAYGREPSEIGSGGSIPLLRSLQDASPSAEFILWGAEDVAANIHGPDESVDPSEIERMVVAEALLLARLGRTG